MAFGVEKGRRVLQADDGEICASFKILEVSAALMGAEAQGWLLWRVPYARASDVVKGRPLEWAGTAHRSDLGLLPGLCLVSTCRRIIYH